MEKQDNDSIQAYDTLYTTNQIQILKILLPYCGQDIRRSLAVLIKFLELQYTLVFTRTHPECFKEPPLPLSLNDICSRIKGYCPPQLASMLEQFQSMQNALQMYEEMQQMMELFQGMDAFQGTEPQSGEEDNTESAASSWQENAFGKDIQNGGAFPLELLMGMLSPKQQELFQMFQSDLNRKAEEPPQEKENE